MMRSRRWRSENAETDALLLGMGWTAEDLDRPQVMIESCFGESHPGSSHLLEVGRAVAEGVSVSGGKGALYHVTDICDGIAQGQPGMEFSLFSRDIMATMVWIHGHCYPADAAVFVASCDKAVPAHLLAMARLNLPSIFVPGGVMLAGGACPGVDHLWALNRESKEEDCNWRVAASQKSTCPTCGACQYMGTAGTMQVIAEALGLALPGSALCPAAYSELRRLAKRAGEQVIALLRRGITPREILKPGGFRNALICHAAVGGSANAVLHLLALARVAGVEMDLDWFDAVSRRIPVIANVQNVGRFPSAYLWYAGGVPALMYELRDELDLDCLTVTGKTVRENLEDLEARGFFSHTRGYLEALGVSWREVVAPVDQPFFRHGGLAVLKGNLCPGGAILKLHGLKWSRWRFVGPARVFCDEDAAIGAIRTGSIEPGSAIVVKLQGVRARGMPELFRVVDALNRAPALADSCIVVTDGRFSGATRGPAIGYVSPEAVAGGPIGYVRDGDRVVLDIGNRTLDVVDKDGRVLSVEEITSRAVAPDELSVVGGSYLAGLDPLWRLWRENVWWA